MGPIRADVSIKTAHLQYMAQWKHSGSTITVHREFVADMDQPVCSEATRKEAADTLARIEADTQLTLAAGSLPVESPSVAGESLWLSCYADACGIFTGLSSTGASTGIS